MKLFYWFTVFFVYSLLKILYRIEVRGKENIPDGPAIIASNHVSFLDPPIIGSSSPKEIHFLANARLFKKPILGKLIARLNSHPVNTSEQDITALRTVLHLLHEGCRVVIFPEGYRSPNGTLQPLKLGCAMLALHAKCPIIPTYITGSYPIWPKNQKFPKLRGKITVTFDTPLHPSSISAHSKKEAQLLLTQELQQRLLDMCAGKQINTSKP